MSKKFPHNSQVTKGGKVIPTGRLVSFDEGSPETLVATGPGFFASLSPNMTAMVSASASSTKWLIMSELTGTPASTKSWSAPLLVPTTEKQELQITPRNMAYQPDLHSYSLDTLIYG